MRNRFSKLQRKNGKFSLYFWWCWNFTQDKKWKVLHESSYSKNCKKFVSLCDKCIYDEVEGIITRLSPSGVW